MTKEEKIRMFSAFLPYDLKVCTSYGSPKLNNPKLMCGADIDRVRRNKSESFIMKPILYDLSLLTKEIEHEGKIIIPLYELQREDKAFTIDFIETFGYEELKVSVYEKLIEWHFNVFQLTEGQIVNKATLSHGN